MKIFALIIIITIIASIFFTKKNPVAEETTNIEQLIIEENYDALKNLIESGWDVNTKIAVKGWGETYPINCALMHKKYNIVRFFMNNNAELNIKDEPSITHAGRYGDTKIISEILENGADINLTESVGGSALKQAIYGNNKEGLKTLIEKGIDLKKYGAEALDTAIVSKNIEIVEILLNHNVDINTFLEESGSTPFHTAIIMKDLNILNLLLSKNPDMRIESKYGYRAYQLALGTENKDIIELIKNKDPKEYHALEWNLKRARKFNIPEDLLTFLTSDNRQINLKSENTKHIVFNSVFELRQFTWNNILCVDLLHEIENYWNVGVLVWLPEQKQFASIDIEHDKFGIIKGLTWEKFMQNPSMYIDGCLFWEYAE